MPINNKTSVVPPPPSDFFTVRNIILGRIDRVMQVSHVQPRQETGGSASSQAAFKHFLFRHGFHAAKKKKMQSALDILQTGQKRNDSILKEREGEKERQRERAF